MDLVKGQTVLVTGGTGGIGTAIAELLAARGARVAVTSRDAGKAAELAAKLNAASGGGGGQGHIGEAMDITDEASVTAGVAMVTAAFGRIDTLINVPGLSVPGKIADMNVVDYDRTMDVNARGMFLVAKHFVKQVDAAKGGLIVSISSVAGKTANPNAPVYCAAKAALGMLMSGLAMQVKAQNIKVTTLVPGAVSTKGFWGDRPVPHEKFMVASDVAEAVGFVCALPPRVVMHEMVFEPWEFFKTKP